MDSTHKNKSKRYGVFSLVIFYAIENFYNFKKNFTIIFIIIYVFVIIDAYIQYIFGVNILGYQHSSGRLSGVFRDEHVLGSYVSRLLPLCFALLFISYRNSIIATLFGMTILICVDVLVYLSGERTAFFYLILSTIAIILLKTVSTPEAGGKIAGPQSPNFFRLLIHEFSKF